MAKLTTILKKELEEGLYQEKFLDVYLDESLLEYHKARYIKAIESFEELYGVQEVEIYSAPGRSEIGGNHTDHQHGKAIATSLNLDVIGVVAKTEDNKITAKSEGYSPIAVSLDSLEIAEEEMGTSFALIRGVAGGIKKYGYKIGGFCAYITSDVLSGSGMSSSAAYEVLIGTILSGLYNEMKIDSAEIAKIGQYAENVYFGKPCGLLDQMAASIGGLVQLDFETPAETKVEKVAVDFSAYGHSLCITDTKGSHADLTDEYAAIPAEMKAVAAYLGKSVLREVDEAEFYKNIAVIRQELGDRPVLRAIHFFEEEKRVDAQASALERGDFEGFKALIKASGDSSFKYLQNVYASKDVQNQGLSLGLAVSDVVLGNQGVSRVHGGGFAGTIQAFVPDALLAEYKSALDGVFGEGSCHILKVRKYGGIQIC